MSSFLFFQELVLIGGAAPACNPSAEQRGPEESQVSGQPGLQRDPLLKNKSKKKEIYTLFD